VDWAGAMLRISDLGAVLASTTGKVEVETVGEDTPEERIVERLVTKAVFATFNRHASLDRLGPVREDRLGPAPDSPVLAWAGTRAFNPSNRSASGEGSDRPLNACTCFANAPSWPQAALVLPRSSDCCAAPSVASSECSGPAARSISCTADTRLVIVAAEAITRATPIRTTGRFLTTLLSGLTPTSSETAEGGRDACVAGSAGSRQRDRPELFSAAPG